MKRFFALALIIIFVLSSHIYAETPEHFYNPPENLKPDPAFDPTSYDMPETYDARAAYLEEKDALVMQYTEDPAQSLPTLGTGEISFTSIKDESVPVKGFFRNYFGVLTINDTGFESFDLVIDINSLDTLLAGRNGRILDIFLNSTIPGNGTAIIAFEEIKTEAGSYSELADGNTHTLRASGFVTLFEHTQPVTTTLTAVKTELGWVVKTAEAIELLLTDFGLEEQAYFLMEACKHKSISNTVTVSAALHLR